MEITSLYDFTNRYTGKLPAVNTKKYDVTTDVPYGVEMINGKLEVIVYALYDDEEHCFYGTGNRFINSDNLRYNDTGATEDLHRVIYHNALTGTYLFTRREDADALVSYLKPLETYYTTANKEEENDIKYCLCLESLSLVQVYTSGFYSKLFSHLDREIKVKQGDNDISCLLSDCDEDYYMFRNRARDAAVNMLISMISAELYTHALSFSQIRSNTTPIPSVSEPIDIASCIWDDDKDNMIAVIEQCMDMLKVISDASVRVKTRHGKGSDEASVFYNDINNIRARLQWHCYLYLRRII